MELPFHKNFKKPWFSNVTKFELNFEVCTPCHSAWFNIFVKQKQKYFWFESHIWFWDLLLYKISFNKQTKKKKINHINDNHIKFEVSLHFLGIWPTVRHPTNCPNSVGNVDFRRLVWASSICYSLLLTLSAIKANQNWSSFWKYILESQYSLLTHYG